jgi:hypothetical protein
MASSTGLICRFFLAFGDNDMRMNRPADAPIAKNILLVAAASLVQLDSAVAVDRFVDGSITTSGDGSGWGDGVAFKFLRDAINAANPDGGDVIKVKGATGAG